MQPTRLTRAVAAFNDHGYGLLDEDAKTIECCAYTALGLESVFGWARDWKWWAAMMISDREHLWSPITATAERAGEFPILPWAGPERPTPGSTSLFQGWRRDGTGHQGFWVAHPVVPWIGWVLHSTKTGRIGPAVRGLQGNVRQRHVIGAGGEIVQRIEPLDLAELLDDFDAGFSWVEVLHPTQEAA